MEALKTVAQLLRLRERRQQRAQALLQRARTDHERACAALMFAEQDRALQIERQQSLRDDLLHAGKSGRGGWQINDAVGRVQAATDALQRAAQRVAAANDAQASARCLLERRRDDMVRLHRNVRKIEALRDLLQRDAHALGESLAEVEDAERGQPQACIAAVAARSGRC